MPIDARRNHFVRIALPPIELGEDLGLVVAVVAGRLDERADSGDVDHAVAHHAAVEHQVAGLAQPVADVEGENAPRCTGDLDRERRIPPHVIDVDGNADAVAQFVT